MWPSLVLPYANTHIDTYTIVRASYVVVALVLTLTLHRRLSIPRRITLGAFAIGVPLGTLATRILDGLEYWDRYGSFGTILTSAGSSIYGAFIVVIPFVWAYTWSMGVPTLRFLDGGAPAMALGEAMTRIGCFLNGCCYGVPSQLPWAVQFPPESFAYRDQAARGLVPADASHSLAVHPVQLYSAVFAFTLFVVLVSMVRRPHRDGSVLFAFLLGYGVLRLAMAPLRVEALASMTIFSLMFVILGGWGLIAARRMRSAEIRA